MIEIAGIPYRREENCIQLISKLAELIEIANFHKNQTGLHTELQLNQEKDTKVKIRTFPYWHRHSGSYLGQITARKQVGN